jgi:hypothetical protein
MVCPFIFITFVGCIVIVWLYNVASRYLESRRMKRLQRPGFPVDLSPPRWRLDCRLNGEAIPGAAIRSFSDYDEAEREAAKLREQGIEVSVRRQR